MTRVRTRFAPSPTGYLHVGGLRTALYSYLYARQNDGDFLLRIEDTDQKRYVEGAVEAIENSLKFFGLEWDEGPFFQSQRTEMYLKAADELLAKGLAYKCYCTSERLEKMREEQQAKKLPPKYDRHCLGKAEQEGTFVIRQLIPDEEITFTDLVRGEVSFHGKDIDDQVLVKSDGFPTYHLANVVDDHDMKISHVIRGEEWLPSTPKHLWLYRAFGWEAPVFSHLPLLLNADKSKLSKRQGDVAAEDYIKKGYLKEAMINFIAFLGWNPGSEKELFTMPELIKEFSIERVQKAGAVFNVEKLDWLNGLYIREKSALEIATLILPRLNETDWFKNTAYKDLSEEELQKDESSEANNFLKYTSSVQSRMKTLNEGIEMLKPFLLENFDYNLDLFTHEKMKVDRTIALDALKNTIPVLEDLQDFSNEEKIKEAFTKAIEKMGVKNGQMLWPVRVALTNEQFSPGTFEMVMLLGQAISLKRVQNAIQALS
jgi:glutamyl-tRNA synthetase